MIYGSSFRISLCGLIQDSLRFKAAFFRTLTNALEQCVILGRDYKGTLGTLNGESEKQVYGGR